MSIHQSMVKPLLSKILVPKNSAPPTHGWDIFSWNSRITNLFRAGDAATAHRCFDDMPIKNTVTWNCMISGYSKNYNILMAQKLFEEMPNRDHVSWGALMDGYVKCGKLMDARKLFNRMPVRNVICYNSMISGYLREGRIDEARELFDEMKERSQVTWGIMITGYIRSRCFVEARFLLDQAPQLGFPQYNALISSYLDFGCQEDALKLFDKMKQCDSVSWSAVIMSYARSGQIALAKCLFEEMPIKDVVSWTTMIRAFMENGDVDAATSLFDKMPIRDTVAWNTMIGGYVHNGMLDQALRLFSQMSLPNIVSWNTILQGYVLKDDMENAMSWFDAMPKDEISWNTLISGFHNEEALFQLSKMIRQGFRPDQATFTVAISVCASLPAIIWGRMMHLHAFRLGYENDILVSSSLITMYSKCAMIADSTQVFCQMPLRDTIAWNSMIAAHAYHGFSFKAFELFNVMIQSGRRPDHVTFLGLLSACAHGGLVDEGLYCFKSMVQWNLIPKPEHYACVVDLLGRSGSTWVAYDFIRRIPDHFQFNTWETLLSACRYHGNLELAEVAAKKVLDVQPLNGGMYVLLSNIYAAKAMWRDALKIRALMRKIGAKKESGCSWIEAKGVVRTFGYNDKSHPELEEIYEAIDNLSICIKGMT